MRLTRASVLWDGEMQNRSVSLANGCIDQGCYPEIDLSGYYLLPGIIDLHGEVFERHIAPRSNIRFAIATGLQATDCDAASSGITTAWLAQSWSSVGGHRSPDYAEQLLQEFEIYRNFAQTDLRVQLRCETHMIEMEDRLLAAIRRHSIDYVVFNNHFNEALAKITDSHENLQNWATGAGENLEQFKSHILLLGTNKNYVPSYLRRLAEAFESLQVTYGSHDDPDGETREYFSMLGAKICEFPMSQQAAKVAKANGNPIIMGASNVVRRGSCNGNISAIDLIRAGLCDALVSEYYYPALSQAAFHLVDNKILSLPEAWALISVNPANIMQLQKLGRIEVGNCADLTVINIRTRNIEATIRGGCITYLAGGAASRFLSVPLNRNTRDQDIAAA